MSPIKVPVTAPSNDCVKLPSANVLPVKLITATAKFAVPSIFKFPPILTVTVNAGFAAVYALNVAPALTVKFCLTVKALAVAFQFKTAPVPLPPTVNDLTLTTWLITTVAPSAITTSSFEDGTTLFNHVAGSFHKPPVDVEVAAVVLEVATKEKYVPCVKSTGIGKPGTAVAVVLLTLVADVVTKVLTVPVTADLIVQVPAG